MKGDFKVLKTKIYGTIGPASYQKDTIVAMVKSGMSGLRINLSHGNLNTYQDWFKNIKEAKQETGKSINIIADVQGPEIRAQLINKKHILLKEGDKIYIYSKHPSVLNNDKVIILRYPQLASQIKKEQIILIDDGLIKLKVESIDQYNNSGLTESKIKCRVIRGGELGDKKGVNLPGIKLDIPSLSEKDKEDIKLGIDIGLDFIMLPFTRTLEDVMSLRNFLDSLGGHSIGILAKIENQEGVDNLNSFLDKIDGVVIARGDLGVEIGITRVPIVQKEIIKLCNKNNKDSIVVTHMLHSMIESPIPTRAEISDIANAVLDGCSGVMLTGETAIGKYPEKSIEYMYDTIYETEKWKQK